VTENLTGTAVGAVIGGLLGGPAGSVILGAGLGALAGSAVNPTKALPLQTALATFIARRGLKFGGMERRAWNLIRVVFGRDANYFYVDAAVTPNRALYPNVEVLDDALYDAAVHAINEQVSLYGLG
jgi:hypothetical protein